MQAHGLYVYLNRRRRFDRWEVSYEGESCQRYDTLADALGDSL